MTWQLPLFFNIIFGTIRSFLDKKFVDRVDPMVAFFHVVLWEAVILIPLYILRYGSFPALYPEMMLLGGLFAFAIGSYYAAIKINLTQSVIFSSYYLLISLILAGIFLSEWQLFDPRIAGGQRTIAGVMLALISLWMFLSGGKRKEEKMEKTWIILISANIILNGIGTYWGKVFLDTHNSLETLVSQSLGGLVMLYIINIVRRQNLSLSFSNQRLAIADGAVVVAAVIFYYAAIKNGPLTVVLPIQTLLLTITISLVGLLLFKEAQNITKRKIAGMVLGIFGVILLMI